MTDAPATDRRWHTQADARQRRLAREGASWLIVFAPDDAQTERVAEVAREHGALMAERYHRLAIQDLI